MDFVRDNPGEPVLEETFTHSHLSWSSIVPYLLHHLLRSMASSLFNPRGWQSFSGISLLVFFGLPLGVAPYTSYSNHCILFLFHNTCPYQCNLFRVVPRLWHLILVSLSIISCSFTSHIHLTILISACWSTTSFSFLTGQVSLSCSMLLRTQLLYNLPLMRGMRVNMNKAKWRMAEFHADGCKLAMW